MSDSRSAPQVCVQPLADDVTVDVGRALNGPADAFRLVVRRGGTIEEEYDGLTVGGPNDAVANGCPDGCPAYLAFGSVLDNQTSDPTTLEAQYKQALNTLQINCIYNPDLANCALKAGAKTLHRAVKH